MKPLVVLLLFMGAAPAFVVEPAQVRLHAQQVQVVPGRAQQEFTIDCRPGEHLLSGGFRAAAGDLRITGSHPSSSGTGWTVRALNRASTAQPLEIGVRCVAGQYRSSVETASCPSGTVLTGGGYRASVPVLGSHPAGQGWAAEAGDAEVTAYAVCVSGLKPGSVESMTLDVPRSEAGTQKVTCIGTLVGGGYETIRGRHIGVAAAFGDQDSWQVEVNAGGPLSLRVTAICVDFPSQETVAERDEVLPIIAGGCVVAGLLLVLVLVLAARLRNRGRTRGHITVEIRSRRGDYRLDELEEVQ